MALDLRLDIDYVYLLCLCHLNNAHPTSAYKYLCPCSQQMTAAADGNT